jgi:peroxiredoxin Q/BCP
MIEPPKATKGRRMSRKSRKKSSKSSSPPEAGRKKGAKFGKIRTAPARSSARKSTAQGSQKSASKRLRLRPGTAVPANAESGPTTSRQLSEGAKAPDFRLPRDGGGVVSLVDFAGRKLVVFFYPRADTPGCTREAMDFTRLANAFAESGTAVLGISADSPKAQEAFRDKHKLALPLLSDEQHEMLQAYGAWGEKSMYGRTFLGIIRTTVLIGTNGLIRRIWRHVKVDGHAEAVLQAARSL